MRGTAARSLEPARRIRPGLAAMVTAAVVMLVFIVVTVQAPLSAFAADTAPVGLGVAGTYSVLGGDAVSNTGSSILDGDLGVSPGSAITGFPPGVVQPGGATHAADAEAAAAQAASLTAYNDAEDRDADATFSDPELGGRDPLVAGVYKENVAAQLTGNLTLDGQGDSSSVWIFQIGSTLTTASHSNISLTNGALACNVYWQVGSSATIGSDTHFVGTVLAKASITANTNAFIDGRLLAQTAGAVSLDTNVFETSACGAEPAPTVTVTGPTTTVTGPTVTETGPTVTETATGPTTTATATSTVTETVGSGTPTATETVTTGPTTTVTGPTTTETAAGPTTTVTGPTTTIVGPTTGPTTTITGPASATTTVTETGPASATTTVTETGPATATETVTVIQEAETEGATATVTKTRTKTATETETKTRTVTETENGTGSSNRSSRTYLADTGAPADTLGVALGGIAMLLLGGFSLLVARRARTQGGRHQ